MADRIIMPKQGLQMETGIITKWLKREGDNVEIDEPLFEMETDKLNIEITSTAAGRLLKVLKAEGEEVPITETIAVVGEPGEDISELFEEFDSSGISCDNKPYRRLFSTPRAGMAAEIGNISISEVPGTGPEGLIIERDVKAQLDKKIADEKAIPLGRKLVKQNDVVLDRIKGTGAIGRMTRSDIEAEMLARMDGIKENRSERLVPFEGMQKAIAGNMMKSLHGMAQANHRMKVDMTEVIRLGEKLKAVGTKDAYTGIIVRIVSEALRDHPILNSSLTDEGIVLKNHVNIGIAVSLDNGSMVPVIKNADVMTIREISEAASALMEKAKAGELDPDEYRDGTFTITDLGMFDIDEFTALINPPESAILALGKIDRIPVAENGNILIKPVMMLSLTYDHRIIDKAPAAQFLQRIKQLLQNPYLLL